MSVMNASYASPTADAAFAKIVGVAPEGIVARLLDGVNGWTLVLTLLVTAVAYDQSKSTQGDWVEGYIKPSKRATADWIFL